MHFSTIVTPLVLAASALAQSTASAGASAAPATPSGSVQVQVVKVGDASGALTFTPSDIHAPPGSMVQFQFYPKNHSVAQSSFKQPCVPMNQAPGAAASLWSGFMPTAADAKMMATWTIMVNDTTPIWLYCAQGKHCQSGMVAAINAPSTGNTLAAYKSAAAGAANNIAPSGGAGGPSASNSTGSGTPASGTGSAGGSSSGGAPASASTPPSASGNVKATSAASEVTFTSSTMVLAGLLSIFVTYAL